MMGDDLIVPEEHVIFSLSISREDEATPDGEDLQCQNLAVKGKEYKKRAKRNVDTGKTLFWLRRTDKTDELVAVKIVRFEAPTLTIGKDPGSPEHLVIFASVSFAISKITLWIHLFCKGFPV